MEIAIKVNEDIGGLEIRNLILTIKPDVVDINGITMWFEKSVYLIISGIAKRLYERQFEDNARLSDAVVSKAHDDVGIVRK